MEDRHSGGGRDRRRGGEDVIGRLEDRRGRTEKEGRLDVKSGWNSRKVRCASRKPLEDRRGKKTGKEGQRDVKCGWNPFKKVRFASPQTLISWQ